MFRRSDTKAVWKMLKHKENSFRIQSLSTVIRLVAIKTRLKWDPSVFREIFSARGASNLPSGSRWWVVPGWKICGSSLHAIYKIWELGSWLWFLKHFHGGEAHDSKSDQDFLFNSWFKLVFSCSFVCLGFISHWLYKALVSIHLVSIHFQNATKI